MALFSSGVEYAIHSLMCMTDSQDHKQDLSVREISQLQGVPYEFLAKIFTKLAKAKLVIGMEGKGGGFTLAKPASQITVLDVTKAIDGDKKIFSCREVRQNMGTFKGQAPDWACEGHCGVNQVMMRAQEKMEASLNQETILNLTKQMYQKAPDHFPIEIQEWIKDYRKK